MRYLLVLLALVCGVGCGGGGEDNNDNAQLLAEALPTPVPPNYITCEHSGDLWLCNAENSCIRDQRSEEVVATEELARGLYRVKFSSGTMTIIAECGSSVYLAPSESVTMP